MCDAVIKLDELQGRLNSIEDEAADKVCRMGDLVDDYVRGILSRDELVAGVQEIRGQTPLVLR